MLTRVGELLTTSPAVWLIGFTVGVTVLVMTSLLGMTLGLLLCVPLAVLATAAIDLKDRMLILRRRILFTRQRTSRRQFLAMALAVFIVAVVTDVLGWLLQSFILGNYDDQVRRHQTRKPPKK